MSTYSPELMCGDIEGPVTCGKRTKNAAISAKRIANCSTRLATERNCTNRTTEHKRSRYGQNFHLRERIEDQERRGR